MRYRQKLFASTISTDTIFDADGNFVSQLPNNEFVSYCRAESNSGGRKVTNGESEHIVYDATIYLPAGSPELVAGDIVFVLSEDNKKIVEGIVLKYSKDRHNCRIWV